MFSNLKNVFRVPDLRNKILFTLFIIAVIIAGFLHVPNLKKMVAAEDLDQRGEVLDRVARRPARPLARPQGRGLRRVPARAGGGGAEDRPRP